jgi:hypothetical protein
MRIAIQPRTPKTNPLAAPLRPGSKRYVRPNRIPRTTAPFKNDNAHGTNRAADEVAQHLLQIFVGMKGRQQTHPRLQEHEASVSGTATQTSS